MTDRGSLNIRVIGEREPTLLFVHGFGCTLDDWAPQVAALSSRHRCVLLDLPGHGRSALPDAASMVALGSAVNVAKRQSGAGQVILVGHSLGAKVVREAYCLSRDNVVGLVLIEGRFYEGDATPLVERAKLAIDSSGFGAFAQKHFAEMFMESSDPVHKAAVLARVQNLDPAFGRDMYLEAVRWDPARGKDTLKEIDVPVLVLQSTYVDSEGRRRSMQRGVETALMKAVAELVPASSVRVVTECDHFPMIGAADTVNRELAAFAESLYVDLSIVL